MKTNKTRDEIIAKLRYARNFTPHKVAYYEEMLRVFDAENK